MDWNIFYKKIMPLYKRHIFIGLDLSINSTGVVVTDGTKTQYHIITNKLTKKQQQCEYIKYHTYDKRVPDKDADYMEKEKCKSHNIYEITNTIKQILFEDNHINSNFDIVSIQMEGVAFGASGDVVGLAGLNYQVRYMLESAGFEFNVISPMQLKKWAVGNGGADKDVMIDAFQRYTGFENPLNVKIDDIADAFFLAICEIK